MSAGSTLKFQDATGQHPLRPVVPSFVRPTHFDENEYKHLWKKLMDIVADLHIHSPYSRATSKDLQPDVLYLWAQRKGIQLVGTGDFTHPQWLQILEESLEPAEDGLFKLKDDIAREMNRRVHESCRGEVRFVLQTEISTIYKKAGKTRKVHHLILLPGFSSVRKLIGRLERIGNLKSDGRPILGLDSHDLLETVLESDDRAIFIPAHIWTPWFSVFGSKSGFDHIVECYEELTPHIGALETGLSSDPSMNWLWSELDSFQLVSNSDAHSASKLGREANLLRIPLSYSALRSALNTRRGVAGNHRVLSRKRQIPPGRAPEMRNADGAVRNIRPECDLSGLPKTRDRGGHVPGRRTERPQAR